MMMVGRCSELESHVVTRCDSEESPKLLAVEAHVDVETPVALLCATREGLSALPGEGDVELRAVSAMAEENHREPLRGVSGAGGHRDPLSGGSAATGRLAPLSAANSDGATGALTRTRGGGGELQGACACCGAKRPSAPPGAHGVESQVVCGAEERPRALVVDARVDVELPAAIYFFTQKKINRLYKA